MPATTASATTMLAIATAIGTSAAATPPKTTISTISASASPNDLAAHEVLVGGAAEVLVDRVLADDQRAEPVLPVRRDDALDDRLDVAAQLDEEQRAVPVARHRAGADLARPGRAQLRRRACSGAARSAGPSALHAPGDETITASSTLEAAVRARRRERALEHLLGPLSLRTAR